MTEIFGGDKGNLFPNKMAPIQLQGNASCCLEKLDTNTAIAFLKDSTENNEIYKYVREKIGEDGAPYSLPVLRPEVGLVNRSDLTRRPNNLLNILALRRHLRAFMKYLTAKDGDDKSVNKMYTKYRPALIAALSYCDKDTGIMIDGDKKWAKIALSINCDILDSEHIIDGKKKKLLLPKNISY